MSRLSVLAIVLAALIVSSPRINCQQPASYDQAVQDARALMDAGKLTEAFVVASSALKANEKRWEAYAILALIANAEGKPDDAKRWLSQALTRAPEDKKATLKEMEKRIEPVKTAAVPVPGRAGNLLMMSGADMTR